MIKFGTDGWRAIIAKDYTFENLEILSQAIADYLKKTVKKKNKKVVIGYDRRFLSKEFAMTVSRVLAANKIKVVLSNRDIPTPAVSFHARYKKYDLGVMITASHNPAAFNGLKIKTSDGGAADKDVTDAVEKLLHKSKVRKIEQDEAKKKGLLVLADLTEIYVKFLKGFVDVKAIKKLKLKVLVDNMYGVGDNFVEQIIGKSKIKFDYLNNEINPSFGGIHPEPVASNLQKLIKSVKKGKYDFGVALDGDADRIALVDGKGNFINAQVIVPLLALHMVKNRKEKGGVGKTVVGSNVIDKVALDLGVACYETPVGFKYLSNLFKQNLICVGGEEAGGIGFKGYIPERDGSISFLLVLEMLIMEKKKFAILLNNFYQKYGHWHYWRSAIPVKSVRKSLNDLKLPKILMGKKVERVNKLDGIKLITKDTWLMFRKSGTEPIVRVYAESKSQKEAKSLVALGTKMIYAL
ncbi:MAG: phosphoglucomutase/phosphomannomutase family protein [Candidatus Omnitrophica bacterium]|nr:phosphoglucomutase/phosphomannomutase family protein [Candidatus Omnitrophota bacterium]